LAEAYGGRLSLWPPGERAAAASLLAARPELAGVLNQARALDAVLDAYETAAPDPDLALRIVRRAPGPAWTLRGTLIWWAGAAAGLASAGAAAGAMIVLLAPIAAPGPTDGWVWDQATAFGVLSSSQEG
jgi:anti-sigma factor RsiW